MHALRGRLPNLCVRTAQTHAATRRRAIDRYWKQFDVNPTHSINQRPALPKQSIAKLVRSLEGLLKQAFGRSYERPVTPEDGWIGLHVKQQTIDPLVSEHFRRMVARHFMEVPPLTSRS